MWKAKLEIDHDCIFGRQCERHGTKVAVVTTNSYEEEGVFYTQHLGVVVDGDVDAFLTGLRNSERVEYFERDGTMFFVKEVRKAKDNPGAFYNPEITYVHPPIGHRDGTETWVIAAIRRNIINEFVSQVQDEVGDVSLEFIEEADLKDVYFTKLDPGLTEKQRSHLHAAVEHNYYDHPRGVSLEELAEREGLSRAAFTESLRAAERKVLGDFFDPSQEG